MHSQPPKSPNPPSPPYQGGNLCQGDLGNFTQVGVIGKCPLIFRIHYKLLDSPQVEIHILSWPPNVDFGKLTY